MNVAVTLMNLGYVYNSLGDYTKARDYAERALAIQEREYGHDHVEVHVTIFHLGNVYNSLGNYSKARDYFERALVIEEKKYGHGYSVLF